MNIHLNQLIIQKLLIKKILIKTLHEFLIMPPAYYKYGDSEVVEFYSRLVDAVPDSRIVLYNFEKLSGYPILVNTSFNVRGEPIVCSAIDAFNCFMGTDLDILVCNIGNGAPVGLMDFISVLEKSLGREFRKEFVDAQKGDVESTYADTTLLESMVNYKANVGLDLGISLFIKWYESYYKK